MINKTIILLCLIFIFSSCSNHIQTNEHYLERYSYEDLEEDFENYSFDIMCLLEFSDMEYGEFSMEYNSSDYEEEIIIINAEWVESSGRDINDARLVRVAGGYLATFEALYNQKYTFCFIGHAPEDWLLIVNWLDDDLIIPATSQMFGSDRYFVIRELDDGRLATEGFEGGSDSPISDITTDQWERWGVQLFRFGGDITVIGGHGTLTSISEFQKDNFYHPFATDIGFVCSEGFELTSREFEMQYIMHHEIADSALMQLLLLGS